MNAAMLRFGLAGALAAGMLAVAAPAGALPDKPSVAVQEISTGCAVTLDDGTTMKTDAGFGFDGVLRWGGGQVFTETVLLAYAENPTGSLTDGALALQLAFVEAETGNPAGAVTVTGQLAPAGGPQAVDRRFRDGNRWIRETGTTQVLAGAATVTASGSLASFDGKQMVCGGERVDLVTTATAPAASIHRARVLFSFCDLGGGDVLVVEGSGLPGNRYDGYATVAEDVVWPDPDGQPTWTWLANGPVAVTAASVEGTIPVVDPPSDPPLLVALDLSVGRQPLGWRRDGTKTVGSAQTALARDFPLTGTVTKPDGSTVTLQGCTITRTDYFDRSNFQAGPKKPPVNDLPSAALPIAVGQPLTASTQRAAVAPEAPCVMDGMLGDVPVPFGRTVWYTFTGTGGDVTIATDGSSFDTVLAVYDAATMGQLACVDDVVTPTGGSLQASATFATQAGGAYLVQIGGYGGGDPLDPRGPSYGTLVVTRS